MVRDIPTLLLVALAAPPAQTPEAEVLAWREARVERLRQEDGWLSLVGLHWLAQGRSTLGADAGKDVVLAAGPAELGSITVAARAVTFCPEHPTVTVDGQVPTGCVELASDASEQPTVVRFGSAQFYVIDREGDLALRVKDAEAPTRLGFGGIDTFPFDPTWRVAARLEPHEPGRILEIPNVLGRVERIANPGRLVFELDGQRHALEAVRYEGDDELFVIFADQTNGKSTYGAGRFVYTPLPDDEGRVLLDFNKAYNPPCVFTPYSTCPLPPPGNRLPLFVEAGEKRYAKEAH